MKRTGIIILIILIAAIVVIETGVRLVIDLPAKTDFYSSIAKNDIPTYQEIYRIKTTSGSTWIHLGWIADPKTESYTVFIREDKIWKELSKLNFGSFLVRDLNPGTHYSFLIFSGTD